jgi:hypothetical protein
MAAPSEEVRFHANVVDLIELIKELVTTAFNKGHRLINPTLIEIAGTVLKGMDKRLLIDNFIKYSSEYWGQIRVREEKFFNEHAKDVFKDLPLGNVDAFKQLFELRDEKGKHVIDPEDKTVVWDFFQNFVKICINYIHKNRRPGVVEGKACYWARFHEAVDMRKTILEWQGEMKDRPKFQGPTKNDRGEVIAPPPVYGEVVTQPIFMSKPAGN